MTPGQIAYEAARAERLSRRPSDEVIEWAELNDGTRGMWEAAARSVIPEAFARGKADGLAEANAWAVDHECPEQVASLKPSHAELALTLASQLDGPSNYADDITRQADVYLAWLKKNDR